MKLRHGPGFVTGVVKRREEGLFAEDAVYEVELGARDKGIAPGQFAAFYRSIVGTNSKV